MIALFKFLNKFFKMFIDFAFMAQIIFTVIILAFTLYWFFDLINYQFLSFLTPVAGNITDFMHSYFEESMNKGANNTDGSLFLFVVFLFVLVGLLSQLRNYSVVAIKKVTKLIDKVKIKNEDDFNAQLRADADQVILSYRNVVFITKFTLRKQSIDDMRPEEEVKKEIDEKIDKVVCDFYSRIKESPCCKFAKNGDQLVVTLKGFTHVDKLLYYVVKALDEMRTELRKENWIMRYTAAIDAFDDQALLKDVYYDLQILLKLNITNEIVCYGNFCNRYYMESRNLFEAYLKGVYDTTEPENVWTLVKKY